MARNEHDANRYLQEWIEARKPPIQAEADEPLGVFVGLRNAAIIILIAIGAAWLIAAL